MMPVICSSKIVMGVLLEQVSHGAQDKKFEQAEQKAR